MEVGSKLRLADALSVDAALFETTVKDFQYSINTAAGNSITNVKVRSRGVDLSFAWRPMAALQLDGGVVYADAEILEPFPGVTAGTRVQRAPKWTGNLAATVTRDMTEELTFSALASLEFSSEQSNQLPFVGTAPRKSYTEIDLRLGLGQRDGDWELALVGKNLTDTRPLLTGTVPLLLSGPFYGALNAPRTVALELTFRR